MTTSTASVGSTLASMTSVGQLNVNSIVSALMTVAQQPITNLQTQISSYQTQLSAYGTLSSSLTTFQSALSSVSTATKLSAQTVSFTDSTSLSATSDGTATNASYDINVSQVAKSQKLASADFANTTDTVGTGTININFGTYDSTTNTFTQNTSQTPLSINITSANNTLSGIRDAINSQNAGVTASIVNDGTGNRLVLTSNSTGASNSMQITVSDADGNNTDASGLSALAYDPTAASGSGQNLTQMQTAQDAKFTVDGMSITKPNNTVTDVIAGVTLNIKGTTSTTNTMSVATDQTSIENSVQSFVTAYNTLNTSLSKLTYYAGTSNSSSTPSSTSSSSNGSLFGDTTTNQISYKLKSMLNQVSPTATTYKTLTDIGVTMGSDGSLSLDKTKLDTAISTNLSDIGKIFAPSATSTSSQISYAGSTSGTQSGTYAVNITQAASSGQSVVGTINGVSANGIGTALTSTYSTTNPSTGLTLNMNGSSTGAIGSVTFSQGLAGSMSSLINQFIDPTSGLLTNTTNSVQTTINGLNTQVSNLNAQLPYIQAAYEQQYSSLNALLSSMSTTSSYVSAQLSSLSSSS